MKILSPNEKIVFLRKKYKISQVELTQGKFSRSYLGMVEIGKTNFNKKFAKAIVNNFNTILSNRGIDEKVELDYLLETKEEQIKKISNNFLKRIESGENVENIAHEVEKYIHEYNIDTKIELYKKIADTLYINHNFKEALYYYLRIFNDIIISKNNQILSEVSLNIIRISYNLENYDEIVRLEKIIRYFLEEFEEEIRNKIIFNLGLTFYRLSQYEDSLEYFRKLEYIKEIETTFRVQSMISLVLKGLKEYDKALFILRSLLKKYEENDKKVLINMYLLELYKEIENVEKVKYYFRKNRKLLEAHIDDIDADYLLKHYYEIANTALYLNRTEIAKIYFEKLMDIEYDDITFDLALEYRFNTIEKLLSLYNKKDFHKARKLLDKYINLLNYKKDFIYGYYFVEYFNKFNYKENIEKTIFKLININKHL
ncbi:MAG: hypothetical protein PWP46_697 [Fusobacteriaceae bacterium]|jgi:tetratricopeptide (TPR) repeat protein|nr:hypothetical protein [Fusobacteriaceae bacterium]